jgi:leader peptidase (prepilin peptidase)/N-methyltransferase
MMERLWAVYSFVIGAVFGSFLNVCISRWPEGLSVVSPRSRCPKCERQITAFENIPLLSWIALRGKCWWWGSYGSNAICILV